MKKVFTIIFILNCFYFIGQTNLVSNGGFETASPCPNYPGQINYATGWNNVNLSYNNFSVGTPDFFHACGSSSVGNNCVPPNTFAGTCSPQTGSGMAGLVLYNTGYLNYREYFSTQLTSAMLPGTTYTVSFSLTNGSVPDSPFIIKNIGAVFSPSPLTQSGWNVINAVPQCEITGYSGTTSWVTYTFTINPSASMQYITIGSFRTDPINSATSTYTGTSGPKSAYAMYFFDDVQVLAPSSVQGVNELTNPATEIVFYPNPANESIKIYNSHAIDKVVIIDQLGKAIQIENLNDNLIDIKGLQNGLYFIQGYSEGRAIINQRFLKN